jgi:hypothetical protein
MMPINDLANPVMARLVTTLIDETTIDWGPYLFSLMLNYNTSFYHGT